MPTSSRTATARPLLQLPRSTFEIALESAAIAGLFTFAYILWTSFSSLPETVPRHFDFSGKADAWGDKKILMFLFVLTCVLHAGLSLLSRYPHSYNYPWPITPQNAEAQYRLARTMIGALKALIVWMFTFITWQTIQVARGNAVGLDPFFLVIDLALIFGTIVIYFVKAAHAR